MICDFHNRVVKRKKDGTRLELIRCADSAGPYFTQEVTEEQCSQCPRHLVAVELAVRLNKPRCQPLDRSSPPGDLATPQTPSLMRRSMNYAEALTGWVAAGRPERTDEETHRIFEQHCSKCAWYDKDKQICRGCGCKVTNVGHPMFNKIKMGTQHCPRNLW